MNRIGTELLEQTKDKTSQRKDLLSVLARVNMHQMNKEEVMSRAYNSLYSGLFLLILYSQRSLLSLPLAMKQQGTHVLRHSAIEAYEF